jgi:hypothetical protein
MLSAANKPIMLSVILLSVIMLYVVAPASDPIITKLSKYK